MNGFNSSLSLELERSRNKKIAASSAVPTISPTQRVSPRTDLESFAKLKKAQVKSERLAQAVIKKKEKIEFGTFAKIGYIILIVLNIIGDILDYAILAGGVTEGISLAYDTVLFPINLYVLGINPKSAQAAGKKKLKGFLVRFAGIENIPIVSMFYLRTVYVVRAYRERSRAATEGIPSTQ